MLKTFIETHFGFILILSCVGGLIIPGLPDIPNESSIVALAALMFVSCYKLQDGGFETIRWRDVALFWFLRYGALPPLLWLIAHYTIPSYATAILLLSVVPAAVSSPAFANIYNGAVPLAFAIVVVSQLATPLLIPLQFMIAGGEQVTPSPAHLFMTLLLCIVAPMIAYHFAKRHASSRAYFMRENKFLSILLIAFVIALAVAKQREVILADPLGVVPPLAVALGCYIIYMVFGWYSSPIRGEVGGGANGTDNVSSRPHPSPPPTGEGIKERITYSTCSCFNNAALAVSLGLMHFPPNVVLFVAASEIGWALLPAIYKRFLLLSSSQQAAQP